MSLERIRTLTSIALLMGTFKDLMVTEKISKDNKTFMLCEEYEKLIVKEIDDYTNKHIGTCTDIGAILSKIDKAIAIGIKDGRYVISRTIAINNG